MANEKQRPLEEFKQDWMETCAKINKNSINAMILRGDILEGDADEMCMCAHWKDIPGYEGKYQMNQEGYAREVHGNGHRAMQPFTIEGRGERLYISLMSNGRPKVFSVERLLRETWGGME